MYPIGVTKQSDILTLNKNLKNISKKARTPPLVKSSLIYRTTKIILFLNHTIVFYVKYYVRKRNSISIR